MTIACIDPTHRDLIRRLNDQRKEGAFCDVLLKVSGLVLPTHACVLSASSPFFKGLIYGQRSTPPHLAGAPQEIDLVMPTCNKSDDGGATLSDGVGPLIGDESDGPEVVISLIDYIYTGKISVKEDTLDLVVRLAEAFMLDGLSTIIKNHVKNHVGLDTTTAPVAVISKPTAESQPVRAKQVVTLPIKRERKTLHQHVGPPTKPAVILDEPHGLRIRKREPAHTRTTSNLTVPAATDDHKEDDNCTTPDEDWSPCDVDDDAELSTEDEFSTSSPEDDDEPDNFSYVPKMTKSGATRHQPTTKPRMRLRRLRQLKRKLVVNSVNRISTAKPLSKKMKLKTKKYQFRCRHKQCDFVSSDSKSIRAHKLIHPGISHVCQTCGVFFTRGCKLLDHLLAATHPETKCSLCEFVADDPDNFRLHLAKHDAKKPFMCTFCDFKCSSRCHLTEHAIKHSSERPFVCSVCNSGFKWKNCLRKHMLTHSSEKNHMCDQCDFRTAHRSTLRLHLRVHSGEMLPCTYDGCTFQAYCKRNLHKHIFTHSKEKPYVCEVCGKKYAQEQSLKRHCRIHDPSARVFHCEQCQFSTTRNDKLRQHTKKAHGHSGGGAEQTANSSSVATPSSVAATAVAANSTDTNDVQKEMVRLFSNADREAHNFAQPPSLPHHPHHHQHHHRQQPRHQQLQSTHSIVRTEVEHKVAASGIAMDRERFHHFPPHHHDTSALPYVLPADIGWAYSLPQ